MSRRRPVAEVVPGMRVLRHGKGFPFGNGLGSAGVLKKWRDYCVSAPAEVSACTILPFGAPVIIQVPTQGPERWTTE